MGGGGVDTYKSNWKQPSYGNGYNPSNFFKKISPIGFNMDWSIVTCVLKDYNL